MQRVLEIDLVRAASATAEGLRSVAPRAWSDPDPALERVGAFGGSALAAALVHRALAARGGSSAACAARPGAVLGARSSPFVVAIGPAVRAGLPTAARASVAALAPLDGGYSEGLVGGDLARRLARVCDALVLSGRALELSVLVLEADGRARLEPAPELAALPVRETLRALRARFGDAAVLAIGPAGERGVPYASLASGGEPPSFVGRNGLGAAFGALGLKALVVRAEPVEAADDERARALRELCARSPRLRARAEGGSLEIAAATAARGDADAPRWSATEPASGLARKGCSGCPTPCGLVFERVLPGGGATEARSQRAHYGALAPFGPALGIERVEDGLALLARCDELGLDAKEAGAVLALLDRARELGRAPGPRARGDVAALARELDLAAGGVGRTAQTAARTDEDGASAESLAFVEPRASAESLALGGPGASAEPPALVGLGASAESLALGALLGRGAAAVARAFGLEDEAPVARGRAVRVERELASRLGAFASARGGDPMRTLAFLAGDVPSRAVLERLVAPARLTGDPELDAALVVAWSEALANALDATGFCAFSAAGLVADGVATLDELARLVAPPLADAREPGRALLALGASVALVQHALTSGFAPREPDACGARAERAPGVRAPSAPTFDAEWARELARVAWPEYARRRGLDLEGRVLPDAWARLGEETEPGEPPPSTGGPDGAPRAPSERSSGTVASGASAAPRPGRVRLRSSGPLARELRGRTALELALPATAAEVLVALAAVEPRAAPFLVVQDRGAAPRPVAVVLRAGRRLAEHEPVHDGDELDLVVVLSGG